MKTSDVDAEFAYSPKWRHIGMTAVFGASLAAFFAHRGMTNHGGLLINGVIELEVEKATRFFYGIAGALGLVVVLAVLNAMMMLGGKRRVALASDALVIPRSRFGRDERRITYRDVSGLTVREARGYKYIDVHHAGGTACIVGGWLDSEEDFEELLGALSDRVTNAGQRAG
jgi:hypothetical protein